MAHEEILKACGLDAAGLKSGALEVRTPVDGSVDRQARQARDRRRPRHDRQGEGRLRGMADGAGAEARRARPPARRGTARRQGGARAPRVARVRQDLSGRPRRGAGDDRHLRLRRRPVAPALRPDDRLRAPRPRDAGDLAPDGRVRRHHRLQFSRRALGVELGAGAGLRRSGDLEAVREDAALRAGDAGDLQARRWRASATRRTASCRSSSAARRPATRWSRAATCRSSRPPARRAWARPSARRWRSASAA